MDIPATGKSVAATGFDYFRIARGKVAAVWQEADQFGVLQQLGVIPTPG